MTEPQVGLIFLGLSVSWVLLVMVVGYLRRKGVNGSNMNNIQATYLTSEYYTGDRLNIKVSGNYNNGGTLMQKLSIIAKKTFDKDTKTLIEAGVLDSQLRVDNAQFVLDFLADKYKAELASVARELLKEDRESQKS